MYDLFLGADLAGRGGRALAHSARPDAPVLAPPAPETTRSRLRAHAAASLHRLASALEPADGGRDRRVGTTMEPGSAC